MKFERIFLPGEGEEVYLDTYIADPVDAFVRRAILVLPGGGYHMVCANREGEPVAMAFLPHGYNAFVLHYTVNGTKCFPAQLIQVAKAIKHIKEHAEEYGIDPEELFVVGFSAGGHLAASAATMWKLPAIYEAVEMPYGYNKPKGAMLIYPVISPTFAQHIKSFRCLWCTESPTKEQLDAAAIEQHVDADSAPAFVVHTANDKVVDVKNALTVAAAYSTAGIPFELHIYPDSPHGGALFNSTTAFGDPRWVRPNAAEWLRMATVWADDICGKKLI